LDQTHDGSSTFAWVSRNLTPHPNNLKSWTDKQIATPIQQGIDRSGNHYKPPMAFAWYQNINTTDMNATIHYLRNLKHLPRN
jgi:hypothetical protein